MEGVKNTDTWKAVRGFWDGRKREDGSSGCGIVIDDNIPNRGSFESLLNHVSGNCRSQRVD